MATSARQISERWQSRLAVLARRKEHTEEHRLGGPPGRELGGVAFGRWLVSQSTLGPTLGGLIDPCERPHVETSAGPVPYDTVHANVVDPAQPSWKPVYWGGFWLSVPQMVAGAWPRLTGGREEDELVAWLDAGDYDTVSGCKMRRVDRRIVAPFVVCTADRCATCERWRAGGEPHPKSLDDHVERPERGATITISPRRRRLDDSIPGQPVEWWAWESAPATSRPTRPQPPPEDWNAVGRPKRGHDAMERTTAPSFCDSQGAHLSYDNMSAEHALPPPGRPRERRLRDPRSSYVSDPQRAKTWVHDALVRAAHLDAGVGITIGWVIYAAELAVALAERLDRDTPRAVLAGDHTVERGARAIVTELLGAMERRGFNRGDLVLPSVDSVMEMLRTGTVSWRAGGKRRNVLRVVEEWVDAERARWGFGPIWGWPLPRKGAAIRAARRKIEESFPAIPAG